MKTSQKTIAAAAIMAPGIVFAKAEGSRSTQPSGGIENVFNTRFDPGDIANVRLAATINGDDFASQSFRLDPADFSSEAMAFSFEQNEIGARVASIAAPHASTTQATKS